MAKKSRKAALTNAADIQLQQPDRSAPTEATLLQLAGERSLFKQAELRQRELNRSRGVQTKGDKAGTQDQDGSDEDEDKDNKGAGISPRAERIFDMLLWSISLATLHFTLDVLVQNQYAVAIEWPKVIKRAVQAFAVFALLFYNLHRHPSDPRLLPGLPDHFHYPLRQSIFFITSSLTGCYLVHITNRYGYIAVMKQAPPVGCLWIWSVIELDLVWAVLSLAITGGFLKFMGYGL